MTHRTVRGIDHIGLTVDDIDAAERFLVDGLGAQFIYQLIGIDDPPFKGELVEKLVGAPPGTEIDSIRMYNIGNGPAIELFHYKTSDQRAPLRGNDRGWQHLAFYVDDIADSVDRAIKAGATLMRGPMELMGPESGKGNMFCFLRAPFGALIEFVQVLSVQAYEAHTPLRRWKPSSLS
jgi:catechol 2,3-dioxygenase-like lactoylglutathione lyase family enzyme